MNPDFIWIKAKVECQQVGGYIFEVKEIENVHKSN
jgi:hypothetical protein